MKNWLKNFCFLSLLLMFIGCVDTRRTIYKRISRVGPVCCEAVSKARIPPGVKLTAYQHQKALAPCVEAIIFYSEDVKYCSDPSARWIKRKQKGLLEVKN